MEPFTKTIKSGMYLFRENDRSRELYLIQSGSAKVYRTVGGKEIELAVLEKGALLGEMALIDGKPRSASVKALTDCTVIIIDAETFHNKVRGIPPWFMSIIRSTCQKIRQANRRLQSISHDFQEAHVVITLHLYFERFDKAGNGLPGTLLEHQCIALLGVSHLTVTAAIDFLCKHQFVTIRNDTLFRQDAERMAEYCEYLRFYIRKQFDTTVPANKRFQQLATVLVTQFPGIMSDEEGITMVDGDFFYHLLQTNDLHELHLDFIDELTKAGLCTTTRSLRTNTTRPLSDIRIKLNHIGWKRCFLFCKYNELSLSCL